jgi:hypothetical protein
VSSLDLGDPELGALEELLMLDLRPLMLVLVLRLYRCDRAVEMGK